LAQQRLELKQQQKLSLSMQTIIHLLSLDYESLAEYMAKAVEENPALEYVPPVKSPMELTRFYSRTIKAPADYDWRTNIPNPVNPLMDLEEQLRLSVHNENTKRIGLDILHSLDRRGYFTQKPKEMADDLGVSLKEFDSALRAVQALEPAGVGARNIEECLLLQLKAHKIDNPLCEELVLNHLPNIAKNRLKHIAKKTGADIQNIEKCIQIIRKLTPTPCSLSQGQVEYIIPEFTVNVDERDQLSLTFHRDYFPSFRPDASFVALIRQLEGDELAYARQLLNKAKQLIRAAQMRTSTIEKVANAIIKVQRPFFLGNDTLYALSYQEVANNLAVHESTIYRTVQNKYLACSQGLYPLSHFFQRQVGGNKSVATVKEMIKQLCKDGNKLSDQKIAEVLETRGVSISRRTVNKYRTQMNIASSYQRKTKKEAP
jgi:RNA polymerase sigma-54 factor